MAVFERVMDIEEGTVLLRSARSADAPAFLDYIDEVAGETDNLTFGSGERDIWPAEDRFMEETARSPNGLFLLALIGNRIVGSISFHCGNRPKLSHSGEFGLSVRKECWGKGIGGGLLQSLLDWAPSAGIGKIHLQVRTDNTRAISLYRRKGFVDEGIILHQFCIGGIYADALCMGLKIGADTPCDRPVPFVDEASVNIKAPVHIRTARPEDAPLILACLERICTETEFLSMGPEGPGITVEEERCFLAAAQNDPGSLYLAAFSGEEVVGILSFAAGKRPRIRHVGDFSLSILRAYGGMGVGRAMMQRLIAWASVSGIHKINLEVRTENKRAINLYTSCGFTIEGCITRTVFYQGGYHDSYAMGMVIDDQ